MELTLLILAAGMGSRYGGIKQLDRFGPSGETIMDYSVYDAIRAGFTKVVFVIREDFSQAFQDEFVSRWKDKVAIDLVYQSIDKVPSGIEYHPERAKPWGTAHAMLMAKDTIREPFAVINADDFYGAEAFQTMSSFLQKGGNDANGRYAMCGYLLKNTLSKHGSVSRGICKANHEGYLMSVEEHTKISLEPSGAIVSELGSGMVNLSPDEVVSMNFWGFTPDVFPQTEKSFEAFLKEYAFELKSELYIPVVIDQLINSGTANVRVLKSEASWFGVTYAEDKPATIKSIQQLVDQGIYPGNVWEA